MFAEIDMIRDKAVCFLKQFTHGETNCCINYKPYENGCLVETYPFNIIVEKFISDYKDLYNLFLDYGLNDMEAFDSVCNIWKEHIVTFN